MGFTGNAATVSSHPALRLLSSSSNQTAFVSAASAAPDGGGATYTFVASNTNGCLFTGSVSGTTLTITSVTNGALAVGQSINRGDTGLTIGTVVSFGTGTGGTGTYNLSASASIAGPLTFTADNNSSLIVATDGARWFNVGNYQTTAAEITAGVTPTNFSYGEGDIRRYGASTASADNYTAINSAILVANAAAPGAAAIYIRGGTYLCGSGASLSGLTAITANNVLIRGEDGSSIQLTPNSWHTTAIGQPPDGTTFLLITGSGTRIYNLTIDGNQAAWGASANGRLFQPGNDTTLFGCMFKNSPSQGVRTGATGGRWIGCHFDNNANFGVEMDTASYITLEACTLNFNGWGPQGTFNINGPVGTAFGMAIRFRSHHITLASCEARQNGLDGLNVNQGSYAIKFIGCLCWSNNDGGFTLTADPGSGPGANESPYDVEYVDCEAYNNWGAGLARYIGGTNITVDGGRYYNNSRGVGMLDLSTNSTPFNGIYVGGGSLGVRVRAQCYDDRQLCPITAASGGVLTATRWGLGNTGGSTFVATAATYPRVALYNANLVFQGYGTITAESMGSVTIVTTPQNGVTIASIAPGWFITQRVQSNGCFFDNDCTGSMDIDGFGFLPGVFGFTGYKSMSGYLASGQNVLLPGYQLDPNNELLVNPTFDSGLGNWNQGQNPGGTGATFISYTTAGNNLRSAGAAQIFGGTAGAFMDAAGLATNVLFATENSFIEASVWCNAVNAGDAQLSLFWNPGSVFSTTVNHPGGGWKLLKIGAFLPAGNTQLTFRIISAAGKTNYFDNASLRVRYDATDNRDFSYPTRNLPV